MSDADRSRRLEELFTRLFDASADERTATLASPSIADVAADVRELLAAHDRLDAAPGGFLERLDTRTAGALVDAADTPPGLTAIGRYPVIRQLARGGMGVVYLARDSRLDRLVALKLLPPSRSADPAAAERLFAEARAASALDHPNIGTVYEIAEADDGRLFIAMAYYEGETLRERMGRGALARDEAVAFGIQLADGLAAAHAHGIVHRDIKPENLIVTPAGVLKIVDFGVAMSAGAGDERRIARGTPAYMSPEQSRAEPVDHRTDVWSAGLVLYEMITGSRAGSGDTLFTADAWRGMPPGLARLLQRCLEPDPQRRLESAAALAAGLRAIDREPRRRRTTIRLAVGAAAAAALVLILVPRGGAPASLAVSAAGAAPAVAVLPFDVRGGDSLDIWREGMVDLISSNLDGVAGLRAIDSRTMLVGWGGEVERDGPPDFERALALARRIGATYAVLGSAVSSGPGILLDAHIYSLDDARSLGAVRVEGSADSIFSLVDQLSIGLLGAMWQGRERPDAEVDLARITTASLPALKAYLNGERALRHADFPGAVTQYERAVADDSTFAYALYRLGLARGWIGDQVDGHAELATAALQQAMRHAERLPARERLLLRAALDMHEAQPQDLSGTVAVLRTVTQRYPDDPDAWYLFGDLLFHVGDQLLIDREESEIAFRTAVALDPGFALSYVHLIHNAFEHRPDSARAAALIATYRRLAPASMVGRENEVAFTLAFGDSAHRRQALSTLPVPDAGLGSYGTLDHPRFWSTGVDAIDAEPLPRGEVGLFLAMARVRFTLGLGRAGTALELLGDRRFSGSARSAFLHRMHRWGMPIPQAALDEAAAVPAPDTVTGSRVAVIGDFHGGAWAVERERWNDHRIAVERLRGHAERMLAARDSGGARFAAGAAAALEGFGAARQGDTARGYQLLMEGQRRTIWVASLSRVALNETIRWWLGDLLEGMNRPKEAVRYFESLPKEVAAMERRARIYERLGDDAKAREAYEMVALAWKGADPEIRPRAQEAEAAARRLRASAVTTRR